MWPNPQETADLVTFTEKILNGKLHVLCSVCSVREYVIIREYGNICNSKYVFLKILQILQEIAGVGVSFFTRFLENSYFEEFWKLQ